MQDITYRLDQDTYDNINALMVHYKTPDGASLIKKSLALLSIAAFVEQTNGEMIVRRGEHETKLV